MVVRQEGGGEAVVVVRITLTAEKYEDCSLAPAITKQLIRHRDDGGESGSEGGTAGRHTAAATTTTRKRKTNDSRIDRKALTAQNACRSNRPARTETVVVVDDFVFC